MTPDSLKQARAKEAVRLADLDCPLEERFTLQFAEMAALIAQRLIDTDWRPPEPINPDLIEARECYAIIEERNGAPNRAVQYRGGYFDHSRRIQSTLLAIARAKGREVGS